MVLRLGQDPMQLFSASIEATQKFQPIIEALKGHVTAHVALHLLIVAPGVACPLREAQEDPRFGLRPQSSWIFLGGDHQKPQRSHRGHRCQLLFGLLDF